MFPGRILAAVAAAVWCVVFVCFVFSADFACGASAPRETSATLAPALDAAPDTIIGVWVSRNSAGVPHRLSDSINGVSRFALSASAAVPAARVVVVADAGARSAIRGHAAAARVVAADSAGDTRFGGPLPAEPGVHLRTWDGATGLPRWSARLQPHAARYWAYADAVGRVAQEHAAAVSAAAAAGTPAPREPMVLLTDLRDVVFQRDVFADARASIAAVLGGPPASGLSVLLAAVESSTTSVGIERWNRQSLEIIFRPHVVSMLAPLPIICSGTTVGGVTAVRAYLDAMAAAMPFLSAAGSGMGWYGLDQPLHIFLLHSAMLATFAASTGAGTVGHAPAGTGLSSFAAAAVGGHLPIGLSDAYSRIYLNATRDLRLTREVEPAYAALDRIAARLVPSRGMGGGSGGSSSDILVLPIRHEDGPICTFGVVPMSFRWVPGKGGETGVGSGLVAAEASGADGPPTACAVVHQYDRSVPLRKHFDVVLGLVGRDVPYCDAAARDRCW
jgi:hypothetical protein